jgi:hypothetical protein
MSADKLDKKQKIAAFGSSYKIPVGVAEGYDLLILVSG